MSIESKIEAQLKAEVAELMGKAEAADKADIPDGVSIFDELARREERLQLAEARAEIEAQPKERFERERAEYEAKIAARKAKAAASGRNLAASRPSHRPRVGEPETLLADNGYFSARRRGSIH